METCEFCGDRQNTENMVWSEFMDLACSSCSTFIASSIEYYKWFNIHYEYSKTHPIKWTTKPPKIKMKQSAGMSGRT